MALKITNNHGIFEINGKLINKNALSLQHHFRQLLNQSEKVVVSLEKVRQIDTYGVRVLTNLHKTAMKNNKIFCVIGGDQENIRQAFGSVNYVLRSDFV